MVLASFAGAAAFATASTSHHVNNHPTPNTITTVAPGVTVSAAAPIQIPLASLATTGSTSGILPTITITDPTSTLSGAYTLTLGGTGAGNGVATGLTAADANIGGSPTAVAGGVGTITGSGTTAPVAGTGGGTPGPATAANFHFTIGTPTTAGGASTYTISGLKIAGPVIPGSITLTLTPPSGPALTTLHVAAVTNVAANAGGAAAPDTAALLFAAAFPSTTNKGTGTAGAGVHDLVVASDYEPQDAEAANYLAKKLGTGVVLTDPGSISAGVLSTIAAYTDIFRVWVVGGPSVVPAMTTTSLGIAARTAVNTGAAASVPQVINYYGQTAYNTDQTIINAVQGGLTGATTAVSTIPASTATTLPFATESAYNDTTGISSPTTTSGVGAAGKTAIIVSGSIDSYQDGVAASALSYADGLPVFLTEPGSLDSGVSSLLTGGGYTQAIVLGGPSAVSNAVVTSLIAQNVNVFRVAGADASETASLLAKLEISTGNGLSFSLTDGTGVLLARGNGFQDALAAGAYAGGHTGTTSGLTPILLSETATSLGGSATTGLTAYLAAAGAAGVFTIQPLGGALSVTSTLTGAATAAEVSGLPTP